MPGEFYVEPPYADKFDRCFNCGWYYDKGLMPPKCLSCHLATGAKPTEPLPELPPDWITI